MSSTGTWPFRVSVVIPAHNEEATIATVVRDVFAVIPTAEVIVVDDCSRDHTANLAEEAGALVIRRPINVGNGAGIKTGVRHATGDVVTRNHHAGTSNKNIDHGRPSKK